MTNTDTRDVDSTIAQIKRLHEVGCEIVRVAVPDTKSITSFARICESSSLPVVADIHFDHTLALSAIRYGAAAVRINPGNIGSLAKVDAVIDAAGAAGIPIRIGVNAGSLSAKYHDSGLPLPQKLVASALEFVAHFESRSFTDIALSTKASSVNATILAYRMLADQTDCPLHIGITEAGTTRSGTVKSAIGIGTLLSEGIGDTLRVSLTADPVEEVLVGWEILGALDIRRRGPEIISCPTCSRCKVDLIHITEEVERRLANVCCDLKVAVMGCIVNGPGEAKEADIGIAAGDGVGVLFVDGVTRSKVSESMIVDTLVSEIEMLLKSRGSTTDS